ncbi:hypothetical protein D3C75_1254050 [compost metagenome]
MHDAQRFLENHLVDGTDHLPRTHLAQVTTALARRAGRVLFGQHVERLAFGDPLLELFGFFGGLDQNMPGLCFHLEVPSQNAKTAHYA